MQELSKCPHCGVTVQIRYDETHNLLDPDINGSWSIWHGNYDGCCPGRFVHHMWFLTEESAISNWNNYCMAQHNSNSEKKNAVTMDKKQQNQRAWLYEIKNDNLILYDGYVYKEYFRYAPVTGMSRKTAFLRTRFKGIKKNRRCATTKETIYENCLWLDQRDDDLAKMLFKELILATIYFHSQQMSILEQRLANIWVNELKVIQ